MCDGPRSLRILRLSLLLPWTASSSGVLWCSDRIQNCLKKAHGLLRQAEELHRTFETLHDVEVLDIVVKDSPLQLCATSRTASRVSRKQYEDSWTSAYDSASKLKAAFNGSCFATRPGECLDAEQCADPNRAFPQEEDYWGRKHFAPQTSALNHTTWSSRQEAARAWQSEQVGLLEALEKVSGDQSSEQAVLLRGQLLEAAAEVERDLTDNWGGLAALAARRAVLLEKLVDPATAPTPAEGSGYLPNSLLDLAVAARGLAESAKREQEAPCSSSPDWTALLDEVVTELGSQGSVVTPVNASGLLDPADFDYASRASEAIAVAAAVSLEAGVLATLAEFNCFTEFDPFNAQLRDVSALQDAAHALLQQLQTALPPPPFASAASAPVQKCFAERIGEAAASVDPSATEVDDAHVQLLSLDMCGRLFSATAHVSIQLNPYTEAVTGIQGEVSFTSYSSEIRHIYQHQIEDNMMAFMSSYANIISRSVDDSSLFAQGDKVVQLRKQDGGNVNRKGSVPEDQDSGQSCLDELGQLRQSVAVDCGFVFNRRQQCNSELCRNKGGSCTGFGLGRYALVDDQGWQCREGDATWCTEYAAAEPAWCTRPDSPSSGIACIGEGSCYQFYADTWGNSSCPFLCLQTDEYPSDGDCVSAAAGTFTRTCSNEVEHCRFPSNVNDFLARAMARFTSSGNGNADGCEMILAYPLVVGNGPMILPFDPPVTVELWVKMNADDIPHGDSQVASVAVLVGVFPQWYVALSRVSSSQVRIAFYHADITLAHQNRQDSILFSEPIQWSDHWRHVAVVVTTSSANTDNVFFYADGDVVSSGRRPVSSGAQLPLVYQDQNFVFHIGPPNMDTKLFPEVLAEGHREPYFQRDSQERFFDAMVDEVRVSSVALDGLTQGARLTELRKRVACGSHGEYLDGNKCRTEVRLMPDHASDDRTTCMDGFETCGSQPGSCVKKCEQGMLRQPDCSCDCQPGYFQAWRATAVHLTGSGSIAGVTAYDVQHNVVGEIQEGGTLPLSITFDPSPPSIAVVAIKSGGSAGEISLEVETPNGQRVPVPEWSNTAVPADRDLILHHRRLHDFFDVSLNCSVCPVGQGQEVKASQLPRVDLNSCLCGEHFGRDLLGQCRPKQAKLQEPTISPSEGYHSAGTLVSLTHSVLAGEVETPWLLEMRYELGLDGESAKSPTCLSSPRFDEGLNVIKRNQVTEIRALLCHPLHYDSDVAVVTLRGNDHMSPPECSMDGLHSNSAPAEHWALNVTMSISVPGVPDAEIFYKLDGEEQWQHYTGELFLEVSGQLQAWAQKTGFDQSTTATCRYFVDARARSSLNPVLADSPLGGLVTSQEAYIVRRGVTRVEFGLAAEAPGGGALQEPSLRQYRRWYIGQEEGSWMDVPATGELQLAVGSLEANAILRVETRVKENGFVWSDPTSIQFLFLAARTDSPSIEYTLSPELGIGDQWENSPLKQVADRQTHLVTIRPPKPSANMYFAVGDWDSDGYSPLLAASTVDVVSLASGGLVKQFEVHRPGSQLRPEDMATRCDPTLGGSQPRLCSYDGEFEVLGGTAITAFALEEGMLESEQVQVTIPFLQDPGRDDASFQANVRHTDISFRVEGESIKILPSSATTLEFDLEVSLDAEVSICILKSKFSHTGVSEPLLLENCSGSWETYSSARSYLLTDMVSDLDSADSLNATVLTTVQKQNYLWAYPTSITFLWLRERSASPMIAGVETASANMAMIWLPRGLQALTPKCYFTAHSESVGASQISLAAVPDDHSVDVADWADAISSTSDADESIDWNAAERKWPVDCKWPDVCQLPLSGIVPLALFKVPADTQYVCAWSVAKGYVESLPTCKRIDASTTETPKPPSLFLSDGPLADKAARSVGRDQAIGANVDFVALPLAEADSSRRLEQAGLPMFLEPSFPMEFRFAAMAIDAADLLSGASLADLRSGIESAFSPWNYFDAAGPDVVEEVLPLPRNIKESDHVLYEVEWRSATGEGGWNTESPVRCIALQGHAPEPLVEMIAGTLRITSQLADASVLYRWSRGPRSATDGSDSVVLQEGFQSFHDAYHRSSQVTVLQHDPNATEAQCVEDDTPSFSQATPVVCEGGRVVEVQAPSGIGRWHLWAQVSARGMGPSAAKLLEVEASTTTMTSTSAEAHRPTDCSAPENVLHGVVPSCSGQRLIADGGECVAQCSEGFRPSEDRLRCVSGELVPASFTCEEAPTATVAVVGATGGLVIIFALLFLLVLLHQRKKSRQNEEIHAQACGEADKVQDWLDCVLAVDRGTCSFCGMNPVEIQFEENLHGPPTLFHCCVQCANILQLLEEGVDEYEEEGVARQLDFGAEGGFAAANVPPTLLSATSGRRGSDTTSGSSFHSGSIKVVESARSGDSAAASRDTLPLRASWRSVSGAEAGVPMLQPPSMSIGSRAESGSRRSAHSPAASREASPSPDGVQGHKRRRRRAKKQQAAGDAPSGLKT